MSASDVPALPRSFVYAGVAVGLALPLFFVAHRAFADDAHYPEQPVDWLADAALLYAYSAPALLAFLGLRDRPPLLLAAALLGLPLALTAALAPILLVASLAYLLAYAHLRAREGRTRVPAPFAALAVAVLGCAGFFALFAHEDRSCWEYEVRRSGAAVYRTVPPGQAGGGRVGTDVLEAGGGCEDRIVALESLASLSLTALALVAGAFLGRAHESSGSSA